MRTFRFKIDGYEVIVSDVDSDLSSLNWKLRKGYVVRNRLKKEKFAYKSRNIYLHRVILERKLGRRINDCMLPDHENRNKWDNCRENLREVTIEESNLNRCRRWTQCRLTP